MKKTEIRSERGVRSEQEDEKKVSVALKTEEEGDKVVRGNDYDVGGVAALLKDSKRIARQGWRLGLMPE